MRTTGKTKNLLCGGCIALLLTLMAVNCLTAIKDKSNTWDETGHLLAGYAFLREGIDYLEPSHPPAGRLISSIPLFFFDIDSRLESIVPGIVRGSNFYPYSLQFVFENRVDGKRLLFWSRLPNILLAVVVGVYLFVWAKAVFGRTGALLSLFLYSCCPNILANAELITTDFPLTAFFFITSFYLYRLSIKVSYLSVAGCGISLGLLLAVKFNGLFIFLSIACLFAFLAAKESGAGLTRVTVKRGPAFRYLLLSVCVAAVAYATIWGIYGFQYRPHPATAGWIEISYAPFRPLIPWPVLPESYLYGLMRLIYRAGEGHAAFLLGDYSTQGWWYYFLVAFAIKTPIPVLILLAAIPVCRKRYPKHHPTLILCLVPFVVFFTVTSLQNINIGIRHILPVYPFLYLLIGGLGAVAFQGGRMIRCAFAGLILWCGWNACSIYPHHLAFFNEMIGGPENGYRHLVDSNLDWGQDLPGLKAYMARHNLSRVNLSYFGLSNPEYYGIDYNYLPSYAIYSSPGKDRTAASQRKSDTFAISATMLQGVYLENKDFYARFRLLKPVEKIGYSIFIYSQTPKDAGGKAAGSP